MEQFAINFAAGNLAGWSFITMAMPLDLIKTKLQLNKDISLQYFEQIKKNKQGFFKTFYKGASSMYLFFGTAAATEYTLFELTLKSLKKTDIFQEAKLYLSGWTAGFVSSLIYTPIEYGKIQAQTAKGEDKKKGSLRRIFETLKQDKLQGVRKIYTGLQYTILREAFGLGIYYGGFHIFLRNVLGEKDRENAKFRNQVASAIFAGLIYNMWAYPFDTFKTNVQSGRYKTVSSMIKSKFWQEKAVKQGAAILLMRGLVADSISLIVYENARNMVEKAVRNTEAE